MYRISFMNNEMTKKYVTDMSSIYFINILMGDVE